ncbi:MAG: chemotaxis protein CheW [Methanobacteriota archaeon]
MTEKGEGEKLTTDSDRTDIHWEDVYHTLEDAVQQFTETLHPSPQQRRSILKSRAKMLAKPVANKTGDGERITVVEFDCAREHYAVENTFVREVIPVSEFTPIPKTPPFILGVIAIRGRIVSLMDLRRCLDLPPTGLVNGSRAVVLADERMEFAILADRVIGLRSLQTDSLQPTVTTLTGIGAEYLLGVAPDGLIVFDGEKILNDQRIIVRSEEG